MSQDFYSSLGYREKQRAVTKANWAKGLFDVLRKRDERVCKREECGKLFETVPHDPKIYCSSSCAAKVNNLKRGKLSEEVKRKIARSMTGKASPYKGILKVPRKEVVCANTACKKVFLVEVHRTRRFCSIDCAMKVIGGKATSPKAARGKAGVRKDISDTLYFYSRWEANIARLFIHFKIKWVFQPKTFDLEGQSYTPDFYLPKDDLYIEVKNFLWKYSKERDEKFRKLYPALNLKLLLKDEYLELERQYAHVIPNWEYRNSKFEVS